MLPTQPTPQEWANHNAVRGVAIWMAVAGVTISLLAVSRSLAPPPTNPRPTRPWSDRCVGVADGDTISVMHHGVEVRVRLNAVDCPERRQAFGNVAKRFTSDLVFGKIVTVRPTDTDRYGRTVGDVLTADGRSLNEELVDTGLAWWYRHYAPGNTRLQALELEAQQAKRGLWADPNPVPPWQFRQEKRSQVRPTPRTTTKGRD